MSSEPKRLPNVLTTVTQEQMLQALGQAWVQLRHEAPTQGQLCLLTAQSAFETGWWKFMHCFNIGNVKSREGDGCDFTYFACWEMYSPSQATSAMMGQGDLVSIEGNQNAEGKVKVWFKPDHPVCRFRAYETLELAATDFLSKLMRRFSDAVPEKDAWGAAVAEDPVAFCHALKLKGYYTGSEEIYTRQVKSIFDLLMKKPFDIATFAVPEVPDAVPTEEDLGNWREIGMLQHFGKEDEEDKT